eukprot:CAMPEP_0202907550 /NCGR_PEP_ID=MMETSP1392-20130828/43042_1 /ASSEMBLY_ACC=CAM_ASM_000868 /TAXON_ID=225041 /ORGANISM="Chlamydomonas chlamydogama, Strain SAG 11-48b" /LENGTH=585 /DNA_ID=CAMNT_0049596507 /DNA_START=23 /DNA_END=1777 /DNA_ORIENTATION=+
MKTSRLLTQALGIIRVSPITFSQYLVPSSSAVCQSQVHTSSKSTASPSTTSPVATSPPKLSFDDHKAIFQGRSTAELLRAILVFRICGIDYFVRNADQLLALSRKTLGAGITNAVIKHTFFNHFCAGENTQEVSATIDKLRARGVSAILDYAAEDDLSGMEAPQKGASGSEAGGPRGASKSAAQAQVVARTYDYQSEVLCDRHVATFLNAIDTAALLPKPGFAAIKLTALGNPKLLERISSSIMTVRGLFKKWDTDGSGYIDRSEFDTAYQILFADADPDEKGRVFEWLDSGQQGKVDYVAWCRRLSLKMLPGIAERIKKNAGAADKGGVQWKDDLRDGCLTDEEVELVRAIKRRLGTIAQRAVERGVKLMVDAEHTFFQPAIDHMTFYLMSEYNKEQAVIFNTYQAYLRDAHSRLVDDMERAQREGYHFGAKLVRGAYLVLERERAAEKGYPSPVCDSLADTHANYERCLREIMSRLPAKRTEVLLGTHNQASVELAVQLLSDMGLSPGSSGLYFGQLLGMADHLTLTLGSHGYKAFKYVPYGTVQEVVPYLLRRAQENASVLKLAKADVALLKAEVRRRFSQE